MVLVQSNHSTNKGEGNEIITGKPEPPPPRPLPGPHHLTPFSRGGIPKSSPRNQS